jgi:hemoglobin
MTTASVRRIAHALVAVCIAAAGCTTAPPPQPSLYERLGGRPALEALVDDAIRNLSVDPRINRRFQNANAAHLKTNLVELLCVRAGGPCVYRGRNMADAHDGMQIRDDEFDALLEDIARAFDQHKVPAPERREAMAALEQMRGAIVGH